MRKQNSRLSLWTRTAKDRDMCIQIGMACARLRVVLLFGTVAPNLTVFPCSAGRQLRTLLGVQDIPEVKLIYQSHGDALQNDSSFGNKPLYCID